MGAGPGCDIVANEKQGRLYAGEGYSQSDVGRVPVDASWKVD